MARSLNQYASRVAHIVGQPDNQSLKERIKDMIKDYFSKYIIQSIDRNGIQPYYKLQLVLNLKPVIETAIVNPLHDFEDDPLRYTYVDFITEDKVPRPMNIKNDAPFTRVCIPGTTKLFTYSTPTAYRISRSLSPTRSCRIYSYENEHVQVKRIIPFSDLVSKEEFDKIELESIWENPEEIIGFYGRGDNQDLELPFPNEMLTYIITEILKSEFAIVPKDIEVTNI